MTGYIEMKNTACTPNGDVYVDEITKKVEKQVKKFINAEKTRDF